MYSSQHSDKGPSAPPLSASPASIENAEWTLGFMMGRTPVMQRLFSQMRSTARHLRVAIIEGESGTGKTLAAKTLHDIGPSPKTPFVPCPATQFFLNGPSLVPATPSVKDARDGTLFLSHVEELSLEQQTRLVSFLLWFDHQHARRIPDSAPRQVFFSSNVPLRKLAATSSSFRADLCHRLTAIRFAVPPLRERREDISLLADYFARHSSSTHGKPILGLAPQALPRLNVHSWPGNVRELESVVHSAAQDCEGQWIRLTNIPAFTKASASDSPDSLPAEDDPDLDRAILRHIHLVLARVEGNKLRAARLLGISRSTLYRLLDAGGVSTSAQS